MNSTEQIVNALKPLADKLGVAAGSLWTSLIQYWFFHGVVYLSIFAFSIFLVIVSLILAIYRYKKENAKGGYWDSNDDAPFITFMVIAIVFAIASLIQLFTSFPDAISQIAHPQWWAWNQILNTITGK